MGQHNARIAPPSGITGAQKPTVLIDWLGFTAPDGSTVGELQELLPLGEWIDLPRGRLGYRRSLQSGHVRIDYDGQPGMGVHVELTGQGCREAEAAGVVPNWPDFFRAILSRSWGISRLDVALDDRAATLSLASISTAARRWDGIVSRWKGAEVRDGCGSRSGESGVYFGAPTSLARLRFYDKGRQTGTLPAGEWVRCELQLRDERAEQMVRLLAYSDGDAEVVAGVLRSYLRFTDPDDDNNRPERRRTVGWWDAFLGQVAAVRLSRDPIVRTLERTEAWIRQQVAPALALVLAAAGGDLSVLVEIASLGRARWRPHHRLLLAGAT